MNSLTDKFSTSNSPGSQRSFESCQILENEKHYLLLIFLIFRVLQMTHGKTSAESPFRRNAATVATVRTYTRIISTYAWSFLFYLYIFNVLYF